MYVCISANPPYAQASGMHIKDINKYDTNTEKHIIFGQQ